MEIINKKLLDSLKCPICGAAIDTLGSISYGCVYFRENHYSIRIMTENYTSLFAEERVSIIDKNNKYIIIKFYNKKEFLIYFEVHKYFIDAEGRADLSSHSVIIKTSSNLFDFRNFDVEKAIHRIKTYLLFQ